MSDDDLLRPPEPRHEELPPDQDRVERGGDPDRVVGDDLPPPDLPDPDPGWQPDPGHQREWEHAVRGLGKGRRPRREDVYPYLLIRAVASGDRGARPLWPPTVCWESPDILLIDADHGGPFEPSLLVASPTAGRSYRVFVRVWNLGLLPAVGVHVKVWAVNPGFFGTGNQADPYYEQHLIGGQWSELGDRTRPECTSLVELDRTWDISPDEAGHHCLLAEVSCPLDQAGGMLWSNHDRHVGQRNLEILAGPQSAQPMLRLLGGLVPENFTLELTHAGPAAGGTLIALGGGRLPDAEGEPRVVEVPQLDELEAGISTGTVVHLLTAFAVDGRTVVVRSDRLAEAAGIRPGGGRGGGRYRRPHPFDQAGATRRLLDGLGRERWEQLGLVTDAPLAEALGEGLARALDLDRLEAGALAARLGGRAGQQHMLRLTLTEPRGELVGGYTVVVA